MVPRDTIPQQQSPFNRHHNIFDLIDNSKTPKVINQLHFRTNSTTILPYLKTKAGSSGHVRFSLNSIVNLPRDLILPLDEDIIQLSLWNIGVPILDEKVKACFLALWTAEYTGKKSNSFICEKAADMQEKLKVSPDRLLQLEALHQAMCNYDSKGFICQFDWCMDHWGTTADIYGVTESTFMLPTGFIEFQTICTPPVIAMQHLANTFPSVNFTLLYKFSLEDMWQEVQFYPFPPFGY
jgi:hypothetical protein